MAEGAGSKLGNIKLITKGAGTSEGATGAGETLGGSQHHSREQESSCPKLQAGTRSQTQKPVHHHYLSIPRPWRRDTATPRKEIKLS